MDQNGKNFLKDYAEPGAALCTVLVAFLTLGINFLQYQYQKGYLSYFQIDISTLDISLSVASVFHSILLAIAVLMLAVVDMVIFVLYRKAEQNRKSCPLWNFFWNIIPLVPLAIIALISYWKLKFLVVIDMITGFVADSNDIKILLFHLGSIAVILIAIIILQILSSREPRNGEPQNNGVWQRVLRVYQHIAVIVWRILILFFLLYVGAFYLCMIICTYFELIGIAYQNADELSFGMALSLLALFPLIAEFLLESLLELLPDFIRNRLIQRRETTEHGKLKTAFFVCIILIFPTLILGSAYLFQISGTEQGKTKVDFLIIEDATSNLETIEDTGNKGVDEENASQEGAVPEGSGQENTSDNAADNESTSNKDTSADYFTDAAYEEIEKKYGLSESNAHLCAVLYQEDDLMIIAPCLESDDEKTLYINTDYQQRLSDESVVTHSKTYNGGVEIYPEKDTADNNAGSGSGSPAGSAP